MAVTVCQSIDLSLGTITTELRVHHTEIVSAVAFRASRIQNPAYMESPNGVKMKTITGVRDFIMDLPQRNQSTYSIHVEEKWLAVVSSEYKV